MDGDRLGAILRGAEAGTVFNHLAGVDET